eukprot:GEMP01013503.1.p1 GENE.GEMP01013503.1~~GEMP01013503.1.p1  ORF type:complete len:577 (+),score=133.26 GEMP01013503.1:133-1863(+)
MAFWCLFACCRAVFGRDVLLQEIEALQNLVESNKEQIKDLKALRDASPREALKRVVHPLIDARRPTKPSDFLVALYSVAVPCSIGTAAYLPSGTLLSCGNERGVYVLFHNATLHSVPIATQCPQTSPVIRMAHLAHTRASGRGATSVALHHAPSNDEEVCAVDVEGHTVLAPSLAGTLAMVKDVLISSTTEELKAYRPDGTSTSMVNEGSVQWCVPMDDQPTLFWRDTEIGQLQVDPLDLALNFACSVPDRIVHCAALHSTGKARYGLLLANGSFATLSWANNKCRILSTIDITTAYTSIASVNRGIVLLSGSDRVLAVNTTQSWRSSPPPVLSVEWEWLQPGHTVMIASSDAIEGYRDGRWYRWAVIGIEPKDVKPPEPSWSDYLGDYDTPVFAVLLCVFFGFAIYAYNKASAKPGLVDPSFWDDPKWKDPSNVRELYNVIMQTLPSNQGTGGIFGSNSALGNDAGTQNDLFGSSGNRGGALGSALGGGGGFGRAFGGGGLGGGMAGVGFGGGGFGGGIGGGKGMGGGNLGGGGGHYAGMGDSGRFGGSGRHGGMGGGNGFGRGDDSSSFRRPGR